MEGIDGHSTARLPWGPRPSQPLTPATGQAPRRPAPASGLQWVSLGHPQPAGHCPALLTASPRLPSGKGGPRPHLASSLSSQLRLKPPVLPPPHLRKSHAHCRAWEHRAAGSVVSQRHLEARSGTRQRES